VSEAIVAVNDCPLGCAAPGKRTVGYRPTADVLSRRRVVG